MRRGQASSFFTLFLSFCLVGPLLAQTPPRTVRVSTIGHVGTPGSLSVAVEGGWRLIDLGDHRLVGEGAGPAAWRFRIGPAGRVMVQAEGEIHLLPSGAAGAADPPHRWSGSESVGFRLEGAAPDQCFTVRVDRRALVYPGAVELWPAGHGAAGLRLINEAPIERYLLGVMTAECPPSFQPEALKALAVAARSYTEHSRLRHQPEADVCDTVHCQVYPGVGQVPERVARAVADTAGVVGLFGGAVIDAVFSADCGGRTRNSQEVWPGRGKIPYLRSVEDRPPDGGPDYCAVDRNHVSCMKLTVGQVGRLLGLRDLPVGKVALTHLERDSSGCVVALRLSLGTSPEKATRRSAADHPLARVPATSDGATGEEDEPLPCELLEGGGLVPAAGPAVTAATTETRSITSSQLRHSFGDQLRGRLVDSIVTPEGGLELECRGRGHGVGLCQWGAQGMALPPYNHTFEGILRHYYSGISLGRVPIRVGHLSLQLWGDGGQPLAGVSLRLLPGGLAGTTGRQGQWEAAVPEGTYSVEARRGAAAITFFAVRVTAGKSAEARLALVWREPDERSGAMIESRGGIAP